MHFIIKNTIMTKTSLILLVIIVFSVMGIIGYALTLLINGDFVSSFSILGVCLILYALLEPVVKQYLKLK